MEIERINSDKSECLLFFCPMCSDTYFWKNYIPEELINNYEIIFVNYPGYGCSPMREFASMKELANYYRTRILNKNKKPMHIIGYSYGGMLIQYLLETEYEYLESVILIACSNRLTLRDKEIIAVLKEILVKDLYLFARTLSLFSHKSSDINKKPLIALQKFSNLKIVTKGGSPILQQLNHILKQDGASVRKREEKVLFIYGKEDQLIDKKTIEEFREIYPNINIEGLKDEAHIIDLYKIFKYIIKFLKA